LARAAVGAGVEGLFVEVHPDPSRALSDGSTMIPLGEMETLLRQTKAIKDLVRAWEGF
jgi:2-dehydro-3-deoxyphosphooctonate aldolase (KDO 8-P synthase)